MRHIFGNDINVKNKVESSVNWELDLADIVGIYNGHELIQI